MQSSIYCIFFFLFDIRHIWNYTSTSNASLLNIIEYFNTFKCHLVVVCSTTNFNQSEEHGKNVEFGENQLIFYIRFA